MLVLASSSPRRHAILTRMGVDFEVESPDVDETRRLGEGPTEYAVRLAVSKAEKVYVDRWQTMTPSERDDLFVLGADTIVVYGNNQVLGKPEDENQAITMLTGLSGRSHHVITGVALIRPRTDDDPPPEDPDETARIIAVSEATTVTFAKLTDDEIRAYVATGEPMDKAGAYGIQDGGGNFVSSIAGSYDNVVGLPAHRVAELLGLRPET